MAALVAWPVARLVRRFAIEDDRHHELIVRGAETLARTRERMRAGQALQARLVGMLEKVESSGAITEPALANQLRQETHWLRQIMHVGLDDVPPNLELGLRQLALEKTGTGLRVVLELPVDVPTLPTRTRHALIEAVRESLTNVAKHASVEAATVQVTVDTVHVTVEVVDLGRGYDPATSPSGTGQAMSMIQRLAEVDGTVEVDTAAGRGTRVVLRVPREQT